MPHKMAPPMKNKSINQIYDLVQDQQIVCVLKQERNINKILIYYFFFFFAKQTKKK
jgi:hypothetical protein